MNADVLATKVIEGIAVITLGSARSLATFGLLKMATI
jgi:hypothetical protein